MKKEMESKHNFSWKVQIHPTPEEAEMISEFSGVFESEVSESGTSDLESMSEVVEGLPIHFGDRFIRILWVCVAGYEPDGESMDE